MRPMMRVSSVDTGLENHTSWHPEVKKPLEHVHPKRSVQSYSISYLLFFRKLLPQNPSPANICIVFQPFVIFISFVAGSEIKHTWTSFHYPSTKRNKKKHITSRNLLLGYINSYSISNIGIFIYWDIDIIGTCFNFPNQWNPMRWLFHRFTLGDFAPIFHRFAGSRSWVNILAPKKWKILIHEVKKKRRFKTARHFWWGGRCWKGLAMGEGPWKPWEERYI